MARPPVDLARKIKDILKHVQPLPEEAKAPIVHYRRTVADVWGALGYVERAIGQRDRYQAVMERHLGRVYGMALVNLVETFERFLKEVAAECVDCLADFVVDDRYSGWFAELPFCTPRVRRTLLGRAPGLITPSAIRRTTCGSGHPGRHAL
jgi:hypothetical protein